MPILIGTSADDSLLGTVGSDTIVGLAGNDLLNDGGGGLDELIGGTGDDTYIVSNAGNSIVELAGEGADRINTQLTSFTLPSNVEFLFFSNASAVVGIGNAGNNQIYGNAGADQLFGLAGDDVLWGYDPLASGNNGAANTLLGGSGNDIYFVGVQGDSVVELLGDGVDEVRSSIAAYRLPDNVENLYLFGAIANIGIGNAANNVISGSSNGDLLIGLDGDDQIHGAAPFSVNPADLPNTMIGGLGNDSYVVYSAGDSTIELPGEGSDIVYATISTFTLQANIESLAYLPQGAVQNFTGIGNNLDNAITGRIGRDTLAGLGGNDLLIGGTGLANELIGGTGDDSYQSDAAGDSIVEYAGEGTDVIYTALNNFSIPANVENLYFTGVGSFAGIGNSLDNVISGGQGADTLIGGGGNDRLGDFSFSATSVGDTLIGGIGDDIYAVTSSAHSVIELAGEGIDQVQVSIAFYTLPANVENYRSMSSVGGTGIGNALDNIFEGSQISGDDVFFGLGGNDTLIGNAGNDVLYGGNGSDILSGGNGNDRFFYEGGETGIDLILDFQTGSDLLYLRRAGFGATATIDFVSGVAPTASSTNSTLLYNTSTGLVSFDADGTGVGAAVQIAQLNAGLTLAAGDFIFF